MARGKVAASGGMLAAVELQIEASDIAATLESHRKRTHPSLKSETAAGVCDELLNALWIWTKAHAFGEQPTATEVRKRLGPTVRAAKRWKASHFSPSSVWLDRLSSSLGWIGYLGPNAVLLNIRAEQILWERMRRADDPINDRPIYPLRLRRRLDGVRDPVDVDEEMKHAVDRIAAIDLRTIRDAKAGSQLDHSLIFAAADAWTVWTGRTARLKSERYGGPDQATPQARAHDFHDWLKALIASALPAEHSGLINRLPGEKSADDLLRRTFYKNEN